MTCANCEALRDRVRILERELGHRRRLGAIGALMGAFTISAAQARLLLALYEAKGRIVGKQDLLDGMGSQSSSNVLAKEASFVRVGMGSDEITNAHGVGYGLTVKGVSMVMAVLEPPELQNARG